MPIHEVEKDFICRGCSMPGVLGIRELPVHQGASSHRIRFLEHYSECNVTPKTAASYLGYCPSCGRTMRARKAQINESLAGDDRVYYCRSCNDEYDTFS